MVHSAHPFNTDVRVFCIDECKFYINVCVFYNDVRAYTFNIDVGWSDINVYCFYIDVCLFYISLIEIKSSSELPTGFSRLINSPVSLC